MLCKFMLCCKLISCPLTYSSLCFVSASRCFRHIMQGFHPLHFCTENEFWLVASTRTVLFHATLSIDDSCIRTYLCPNLNIAALPFQQEINDTWPRVLFYQGFHFKLQFFTMNSQSCLHKCAQELMVSDYERLTLQHLFTYQIHMLSICL